jgi:hypothetical protein
METPNQVLRSYQQAAATPASSLAGDPPETKQPDEPPRGRVTSHDNSGTSAAEAFERFQAAAYRHKHGNPRWTPEEAETHEARSSLIQRTWKTGREMTRAERRLLHRYEAILKRYADADLEAYRAAKAGQPDDLKGPGL